MYVTAEQLMVFSEKTSGVTVQQPGSAASQCLILFIPLVLIRKFPPFIQFPRKQSSLVLPLHIKQI